MDFPKFMNGDDEKEFIRKIELLALLKNWDEDQKLNFFKYSIPVDIDEHVSSLTNGEKSFEKYKNIFIKFIAGRRPVNSLAQILTNERNSGESLHDFAARLKILFRSTNLELSDQDRDKIIKEKIMDGYPSHIKMVFQTIPGMTLEETISKLQGMGEGKSKDEVVGVVGRKDDPIYELTRKIDALIVALGKKEELYSKETLTCFKCGKKGHISRVCRMRQQKTGQTNMVDGIYMEVDKDAGEKVKALVDTGSANSLVNSRLVNKIKYHPQYISLTSAGGQQLTVVGSCNL